MKVNLLLADHADAVGGKLYINGGGWNVTGPQPVPSGVAMLIEVPWDQTNTKHQVLLELLDVAATPSRFPEATAKAPQDRVGARSRSACGREAGDTARGALRSELRADSARTGC